MSMKMRVGDLRRVIREVAQGDIQEHEGFRVGEWYKGPEGAGELKRIYVKDGIMFAEWQLVKFGLSTRSTQRFDVWSQDKVPSSPAEGGKEVDYLDTSREGT